MDRCLAILLLGPTGSGKTPLGDHLQRHGLSGRRCAHFDFGECLRQVGAGDGGNAVLSPGDLAVVRRVLTTGALLEDHEFSIALAVLRKFIRGSVLGDGDLVVLNGLPRHVGQARDLDPVVDVRLVVQLDCAAAVVALRIASNAGGDRAGRADDRLELVRRKVATYRARTLPLVAHYEARHVPVARIVVSEGTSPQVIVAELEREPVRYPGVTG